MRSGGPRTEAGKAAVSRNALKHGLLSETPLLIGHESQGEWEEHRRAMLDALQPRDQAEACLVERAAFLHWRLRRVARAEAEAVASQRRRLLKNEENEATISYANSACGPFLEALHRLELLSRYEAHLGRELARTMKSLHDLQSRPAAGPEEHRSPLPAGSENCETDSHVPAGKTKICETNSRVPAAKAENCETNSGLSAGHPDALLPSRDSVLTGPVPLASPAIVRPLPVEAEALHRSRLASFPCISPIPDIRKLFP